MVNARLHIIRIFVLLLMLIGGTANNAWSNVTYHILTLPFTTKKTDGTNFQTDIRVEALRVVVKATDNEGKVGLPADYKSPLLKDAAYHYYSSATVTTKQKIYQNNDTKLDIYSDLTGVLTVGTDAVSDNQHIYVIYDYDPSNSTICTTYGQNLKLDGTESYNIEIGTDAFFCLNVVRGNRPALLPKENQIKNINDLTSTEPVEVITGLYNDYDKVTGKLFYFRWHLMGNDPYNIKLVLDYDGDATYVEEGKTKPIKVSGDNISNRLWSKYSDKGSDDKMWISNETNYEWKNNTWTRKEGVYRGSVPSFDSFVLLNHDEANYTLVATKINHNGNSWQPNKNGDYMHLGSMIFDAANQLNPKVKFWGPTHYPQIQIFKIKEYVFKVKTPLSNTVFSEIVSVSDYYKNDNPKDHIPDALKRKYVTFTGGYKEDDFENPYASFAAVEEDGTASTDASGRKIIWLKYETSIPFETLSIDGSYQNARWYTMRMNADVNEYKYIAYDNGSCSLITTNESGAAKGDDSNMHTGENSAEVQVAFMGDPFELKILSRKASETATPSAANRYIGCATDAADNTTLSTDKTGSSDISTWEIAPDNVTGSIVLRKFESYANPMYIGLGSADNNKPVTYSSTASRIKVVELEKKKYMYHIVRSDGSVAVMASTMQDVGQPLNNYTHIPEDICTPFLNPTLGYSPSLSFYYTKENATASSSPQINAPYAGDGVTEGIYAHVYVRYSFGSALPSGMYNVRLNRQYISYNSGSSDASMIDSSTDPADNDNYVWSLDFNDPYAMIIRNLGTKTGDDPTTAKYVKINGELDDGVSLTWDASSANATKFIIKSSGTTGIYEVMVSTAETKDAATTYYNIGRNNPNEVRIFSNATYRHTYTQLRFLLTSVGSSVVNYYLIDKSNKKLLEVSSRRTDVSFPGDYRSPLIDDDGYHYWASSSITYNSSTDTYSVTGDTKINDIYDAIGPDEYTTTDHGTDSQYYDNPLANTRNATDETDFANIIRTLTATGVYEFKIGSDSYKTVDVTSLKDHIIYVTYDTNDLVNLKKGVLYRLKFDTGDSFRQEDGHDDLTKVPVQAVYPYCNGDCNFFVYGDDEYELQQQGAASTRTRWVWYLESDNNDPYHVKICSRQQEEYPSNSGNKYIAYFRTYAVKYNQDAAEDAPHIITTLAWPGITPDQGTEYMVLGSAGMYQLLTTETIPIDLDEDGNYDDENESNERHVVKSFEQYWKTYDTVKNKLLKDILEDKDKGASPTGSTLVPNTPASYRTLLTGTDEGQYGFHSYPHWAYAKRFNGYNNDSKTKKGWEEIEHWYQTVNMGDGYFDFVKTTVDPALILLDQHGWEIMRKPLPSSPEDPEKEDKYKALKIYDSPMVKEYYFWASSKKMTNYHQYYNLSDQITVDGEPYTSTSLTNLPPYATAKNVKDAKGNLNDQYVTYVVKDEYAKSYNPATDKESGVGTKFLIQQGNNYVSTADGSTLTTNTATGGMAAVIVAANGSFSDDYLWYVKPNPNIDNEMGYGVSGNASSEHKEWKADYTDDTVLTGYPSNGFDPYNIQIQSAKPYEEGKYKYFVTNGTEALLDDGIVTGNGTTISLGTGADPTYSATKYYDGSKLAITNKTFMAVADADGSIQLMPRFDQNKRIRNFSTLETPVGEADKLNEMKTSLYLPTVYEYHIIDNSGNESLRYKSGGDLNPQTPDHFKSPLAKDFKYYSTLTDGVVSNEITASFASATLTDGNVYVRYQYDEPADAFRMLEGKWLTMQLNENDAIYNSGIKQASGDKPESVDASHKDWQWKFLETPQSTPDPYAVYLFNRSQSAGTKAIANKFAILSHTSGGYALAEAGSGNYTYKFLNGASMSASDAADVALEPDFTSTAGTFSGTNSQVKLLDDVEHTFTYKIYTNSNVLAIDEEQDNQTVQDNDFKPVVPDNIKSPLLKPDYFRYYNKDDYERIVEAKPDTAGKKLSFLYGLYDDIVCVRYVPYNPDDSPYKVPNVMGQEEGHITRGAGSNDAGLGLDGKLLYNIAWYNDQMMKNNAAGDGTESTACGSLSPAWTPTATPAYEWHFDGSDPYAIKIKSVGASDNETSKYVHQVGETTTCNLDASATTFMILNKEDYDYGVLAVTGDKTKMLTFGDHDSNGGTPNTTYLTTSDPTRFIFYALATHKVIYHLVIAPTATNTENPEEGCYEIIPYWNGSEVVEKKIPGSTQRDLTSIKDDRDPNKREGDKYQLGSTINGQTYSFDAGHISLGDKLSVPSVFYRPNVGYIFVVEGVYSDDACTSPVEAMNTEYKGHEVTNMGDDSELLNTVVRVNIVYTFDGTLDTNNGLDFVRSISDNKWYSFETSGSTPWMAQFTNAWGLEVKEGRGTHYTNDYLWSPLGDPYGFRMYNRYIYKNSGATNSGEHNRVMTTIDNSGDTPTPGDGPFAEGKAVTMSPDNSTDPKNDPYNVYELLSGSTDGYFYVHPVTNDSGTKYYLRTKEYDEDKKKGTFVILSKTPTNFTFGLSDELVEPYFDLVGYVGGLKENVANSEDYGDKHINVKSLATAIKNGTPLTALQLMDAQTLVYNDANLVPFTSGYYRMHSPEGLAGIDGIRYASGYTHKREESDAVPMHFYKVEGTATQFNLLKSKDGERVNEGFTSSDATRGDIPIPAVENDPASIFYITGTYDNAKIQTQGLYVKGEIGKTEDNGTPAETIEAEGVRAKAQMTSTVGSASALWIMDIGGGVMLIHDRSIPQYRKYLSYDQTDANHIYDLKLTHNTHTDHAKWCLQPANNLGLKITTHSGGDEGTYGTAYNYSTFYAPFDILLPDDEADKNDPSKNAKQYRAFICDTNISPWNDADLHPRPISWYNIEENSCPSDYRGSMKFVPAGTPVILAAIDDSESGYIKVTIPTSAPSLNAGNPLLTTGFKVKLNGTDLDAETRNNTLTGQYLEQKLDAGNYVYVFGLPYSGTFSETDYESNGDITATLPSPSNSGWGFYKNINPNKEASPARASWTRNNWYILGNKAYYRAAGGGSGARGMTRGGIDFVPVVFDWEDVEEGGYGQMEEEELTESREYVGDGCVYDMQGRRVATEQQVLDGTWKQRVSPGIYIINGKKISVN